MKILVTICSGIIMTGVAYSLYNAANDYGLATISLPPAIIAQDDDTSGDGTSGDGTSGDGTNGGKVECNGYTILCEQYLHRELKCLEKKTGSDGLLTVLGVTFELKKNKYYTVMLEDQSCRPQTGTKNICVKSEEGTVMVSIEEGRCTNGNSTNNR